MQYEEFIEQVQERAELDTKDEAIKVTEATLETFGERLYRTERKNLGAQLPGKLEESLYRQQPPERFREDTERFSLEEFYNRVSARAAIGYPEAVEQSQVVMGVIQEAISRGELKDIFDELPSEYFELFGIESETTASPSVEE